MLFMRCIQLDLLSVTHIRCVPECVKAFAINWQKPLRDVEVLKTSKRFSTLYKDVQRWFFEESVIERFFRVPKEVPLWCDTLVILW